LFAGLLLFLWRLAARRRRGELLRTPAAAKFKTQFGVEAKGFAGLGEADEDGAGASAPGGASEQPILAAHRDPRHRPLRRVAVNGEDAVVKVAVERGPIREEKGNDIERWSPTLMSGGVSTVDRRGDRMASARSEYARRRTVDGHGDRSVPLTILALIQELSFPLVILALIIRSFKVRKNLSTTPLVWGGRGKAKLGVRPHHLISP
jgi:hypothetical protein